LAVFAKFEASIYCVYFEGDPEPVLVGTRPGVRIQVGRFEGYPEPVFVAARSSGDLRRIKRVMGRKIVSVEPWVQPANVLLVKQTTDPSAQPKSDDRVEKSR